MDDSDEKDSREDFLSRKSDARERDGDNSQENQDDNSEETMFNIPKVIDSKQERDIESFEINHPNPPVSDAKLLVPELNHLNALANLDPSSKFADSALMRDMRFMANVTGSANVSPGATAIPGEDETNKVFMCHLCDFKTAYANSLMNHQAVHSDIRPWACAMCEYAAKRKQDLKKHLHTVHGMMVESPMLKPVLPSNAAGIPKFPTMNDGFKDQFAEGLNLKRSSSTEHEFSFYQTSPTGHHGFQGKRIKEEMSSMDMMSPPLHERKIPSTSETEDSPDDNLPICFPPSTSKLNEPSRTRESPLFPEAIPVPHFPPHRENGDQGMQFGPAMSFHAQSMKKLHEPPMRDWSHFTKSRDVMPFPSSASMKEKSYLDSIGIKTPSFSRMRDDTFNHSLPEEDITADNVHKRSMPLESAKPSEPDRSISSSSTISHARWTQTQTGFMCEHCDILFFQRAMYLMHVGLHSPGDPWCCAVCGQSFSEKYSFTSHFINQH